MAKPKQKSNAEKFNDFLDEYGLKDELKQAGADFIKEAIKQGREMFRQQSAQIGAAPSQYLEEPEDDEPLNPFVLLGVRENAPEEVVKAAYRALVKMTHPDIGGAQEDFQLIHDAFDWIKDHRGWA